jgi:MFS family permease
MIAQHQRVKSIPDWLLALSATLLAQSASSFMGQCLPVVAPLLTRANGLEPERIGNLSSLNSLGACLFLAFGSPILARLGPVRSMQIGALTAAAGMALAATGSWPALVIAALMLGIGYGPTPPSGSRILARTAPPAHRTLIFSIKQAGAPAGGALAGLIVAPIAAYYGWPAALLVAVGVGSLAALVISPLRAMMDEERDRRRSVHPRDIFSVANVMTPVRALTEDPAMMSISALALSFAIVQGVLFSFSVTYLTEAGMSLGEAGLAYACMQGAGVFARIFLGYLADRTGQPAANLTVQAFIAAGCVFAYAGLPPHPPLALAAAVALLAGFFGCSWNGIYMAEIARLAPPHKVADATSGSTLLVFLGYVAGPSLFAAAVPLWGWQVPYRLAALQLAVMAVFQSVKLLRAAGRFRRG